MEGTRHTLEDADEAKDAKDADEMKPTMLKDSEEVDEILWNHLSSSVFLDFFSLASLASYPS